jgi:hypothetical protein
MPKDTDGAEKKNACAPQKAQVIQGRALIKGMTRRLPIQLLGDLSFQEGLEKIMRSYTGVYALYRGKRLYYVGLATNLYNRLRGHTDLP